MKRFLFFVVMLALTGGAAMIALPPEADAQGTYSVKPACEDSLQAILDAAAPGSTVQVRTDCIYRERVKIRVPMVLDGQGGAEIRGSDVWTTWIPVDGLWVSANPVPFYETEGFCEEESDGRCLWPEQVFRDGVALRQVAAGTVPGPGQFSLNAGRQVVIADDPTSAVMEVSTRTTWMEIDADDVTVRGFTMKHAATDAQAGALRVPGAARWTIEGNTLSDGHGIIISFWHAPGGTIIDNEIFNAGQLGIGGATSDAVIRGNVIYRNNTERFDPDWEAGGMKITNTTNIEISDNEVYLNHGPGIWCDIDCREVRIHGNNVYHNDRVGIYFEISDGAEIFQNRVWSNVWGEGGTGWAGIFISSSSNARVYENIVAWNGDGIVVMSQCRAPVSGGQGCDTSHRWSNVSGNEVFRNTIIMAPHDDLDPTVYALGWQRDIVDESGRAYRFMFSDEANNRGYENRYWISPDDRSGEISFAWSDTSFASLDQFNATPGEENGRYLDEDDRDRILTEAGISPEPDYPDPPWTLGGQAAWR